MKIIEELSRQELAARLVSIYRWESTYEDYDEHEAEVKAINALLAAES